MKAKPELKAECIRLRVEERMSLKEIQKKTGASRGSLSAWLRPHPLSSQEQQQRMVPPPIRAPKVRGAESPLHQLARAHNTSPSHIGRISEAAVLLRLLVHGYTVYGSPFDGDKADWVVDTGSALHRLQVKTAVLGATGLPAIRLTRNHGKTRYLPGEFDFVIGYDIYTDTAYVWDQQEVQNKSTVSICPEAMERWDKLRK